MLERLPYSLGSSEGARLFFRDGLRGPAELAQALCLLHDRDMLHRDTKPENVLLDHEGELKLIDFGCARSLKEGEEAFTRVHSGGWIAPEIRSGAGYR